MNLKITFNLYISSKACLHILILSCISINLFDYPIYLREFIENFIVKAAVHKDEKILSKS